MIQMMKGIANKPSELTRLGSTASRDWREKNSRLERNSQASFAKQACPASRPRSRQTHGCIRIRDVSSLTSEPTFVLSTRYSRRDARRLEASVSLVISFSQVVWETSLATFIRSQ